MEDNCAVPGLVLSETEDLEFGRYPGLKSEKIEFDNFVKHKDVAVTLRDGVVIYVDLYRPLDEHLKSPALVTWSPYGKHGLKNLGMMPGADVDASWVSPHTIWEGPDPAFWCERGYTIVSPDPRGAWSSEGTLTFFSDQEADDGYDLIEWIAAQPWSNGKVGMLGVSYLAISQWRIAAKRPPSLAAICPWEGMSDVYRELYYHGGIPEEGFLSWWQPKSRFSTNPAEDVIELAARHPLIDDYWRGKEVDMSAIDVPALVVASWSDQGMHTRGTLEGFKAISSKQKWLYIHGQKKWKSFYEPGSVAKQLAFFDHFLCAKVADLASWPPVEIEIREDSSQMVSRSEQAWPIARARPAPLYLDCSNGSLSERPPGTDADLAYEARADGRAIFVHTFDRDTELTGGMRLHAWVSCDDHDEMDLFVGVAKIGVDGEEVGFNYYSTFSEGPVALGWLRASHRELGSASTELQPVHPHTSRLPLERGVPTLVDVEIWPSSTLFRKGERLRLTIAGSDLYVFDTGAPELRHRTDNLGTHRIHSGPSHPSYLLTPKLDGPDA